MRYIQITYSFIFLLFSVNSILSQDTIKDQFIYDSLKIAKAKLVRFQFKVDNRQAFYGNQALAINGFDLGVLLSNKLRVTGGYYSMKGRLKQYDIEREGEEFTKLIEMNYGSINTELIYKDWRFFSLGMPFEIAAGINTFKDKNITTGEVYSSNTRALMFINFGVSGTFKPMRFLGLKAILGYRKQAFNQQKDFNFDGFFTSIGLNLDVQEITRNVKMYRLQKKYHRGNNISNAVNILTD